MKKIFFLLIVLSKLSALANPSKQSNDSIWKAAAEAYRNKAYEQALANYDTLINRGFKSAILFNNTGNAAFKSKHMGKAVWCYEMAYRLDPSNEDIKYNKNLMHFKIADRIEELPSIAPIRWANTISQFMAPIYWYWLAVLFAILFTTSLYFRHRGIGRLKLVSRLSITLTFFSILFAFRSHYLIYEREFAVVQFPSVSILSAPDATGVELFQLHEGVVVEIKASQANWQNIRLADGKEGWMSKEAAKGF